MRRFECHVLTVLLAVALLSLGGCGGGGGGGDKGGGKPTPTPGPGGYRLEDFRGEWKAEDAAGTLLMEGSEESVEREEVRVKILPSSQVALSVEYFGSEKEYSSNAFSEARESAANVFVLKFKETRETSGSMTFTVVDSETLEVVEKGTTMDRGKVGELRYTLRRINSALSPEPEPNPDLNPGPSPAPGGPVDLARLNGNWRPYDGRGTFTGANGEIHKMVLKSTSLLTCTYIRPPSPHAGEVMIMQTLNWASEERGSRRGFKTGHKADTPCRGTKGEYGTKITFEDGSTMEIIDPKTPAYFLIHEKGNLYERGVLYRYDLTYRIERRS